MEFVRQTICLRQSTATTWTGSEIPFRLTVLGSEVANAPDAWLDESYVSRLITGERANPSRDALILVGAFGLELPVPDLDEILMAADYKPLVLPASIR